MSGKTFALKSILAAAAITVSATAFGKDPVSSIIPGTFIRGADVSCLYDIEQKGIVFKDIDGTEKDMLTILRDHGANWIRLRVWVNPEASQGSVYNHGMCTIEKAAAIGKRAKELDMKILLALHYSDTWATPEYQRKPAAWDKFIRERLITEIGRYSRECMVTMKNAGATPDMVQIGNEINNGILLKDSKNQPTKINGKIGSDNFADLVNSAISEIKGCAPETEIMLHFSKGGDKETISMCLEGIKKINDYDCIGLSWYPFYRNNKTMKELGNVIRFITSKGKKCVIAETSFPWTCDDNEENHDNVRNAVWYLGDDSSMLQVYDNLIEVPGFAYGSHQGKKIIKPSKFNQQKFMEEIKKTVHQNGGSGFFYWGGEWIFTDSQDWKQGSTWENQALFDLNHNALPVLDSFKN
ncbi:arabinogalactan endo-beta-1,4-galactanase [Treponema sp.]|uniref:glycoside hydrolase family 53 protein n=1 Tax=Treponema sp. TaxID=166 RepID=UPI00388FB16A